MFVGLRGRVVALRKADGAVVWTTKLNRGASFVPIVQEGDRLFATSAGEVTCLDAATGTILWHNPLKGYGTGYAAIAGVGFPIAAAASEEAARAAAAGAAI